VVPASWCPSRPSPLTPNAPDDLTLTPNLPNLVRCVMLNRNHTELCRPRVMLRRYLSPLLLRTAIAMVLMSCLAPHSLALALKKGQHLSLFRAELLREGWKPIETYKKAGDGRSSDVQFEHAWGDAGYIFRSGYREVQSCTGTGLNYCIFNYRRHGRCLQVGTHGEYLLRFKAEPELDSWRFVCPR
jgi:hypothetical protein